MKFLVLLIVLGCFFTESSAKNIVFGECDPCVKDDGSDCDEIEMHPVANVSVNPCHNKDGGACQLKMGESYTIGLDFTAPLDTESLKAWVGASLYGMEMPWVTFRDYDACDPTMGGITCPMTKGNVQHYRYTMNVAGYPLMPVTVIWRLYQPGKSWGMMNPDAAPVCIKMELILVDEYDE